MKNSHVIIANAVAGLLALGASAIANSASSANEDERCYGVAKAGQNACKSNSDLHSCATRSKVDNDSNDFIYLPKGSCLKIGGKLEPAGGKVKTTGK